MRMRRSTRKTGALILDLVTLTPAGVPLPPITRVYAHTIAGEREVAHAAQLGAARCSAARFSLPPPLFHSVSLTRERARPVTSRSRTSLTHAPHGRRNAQEMTDAYPAITARRCLRAPRSKLQQSDPVASLRGHLYLSSGVCRPGPTVRRAFLKFECRR